MLRFSCPKCTQIIECDDTKAGKKVACPICKAQLQVPAVTAKPEPKPKPTPATTKKARDETEEVDDLEEVAEEPSGRAPRKAETPARRPAAKRDEVEEVEEVEEEPVEEVEEEEAPRKKGGKSAAKAKLGKKIKTYEPSHGMLIFLMVVCALLMLGGLVFLAAGVIVTGAMVLLALIMIPLGLWGFLYSFNLLALKVVHHEGGLHEIRRHSERVIPWEDMEYVWQQITEHYTNGAYTGTTYVYTMQLYDGTKIKYTNNTLKKVEKLGQAILHETSQVLYPKALSLYNKGKTVDFGTLGVSKDGLSYGSKELRWEEIDAVKIKQGYISIRKRGKWLNWGNIAVATIPNLLVFLALINQIVGVDDG